MIEIKSIYLVSLVEMFLSLMNDKVLIGAIKLEQSDGTIFSVKNYFPILLVYFLITIMVLALVMMMLIPSIGLQILRLMILNLNSIIF